MYLQVSPSPCRALKWKPQTPNTEHKLYELLCAAAEQLRGSKRVPFSVECTVTEASQAKDSSGKDKQVLTQIQFSEKPDLIFLILGSAGQVVTTSPWMSGKGSILAKLDLQVIAPARRGIRFEGIKFAIGDFILSCAQAMGVGGGKQFLGVVLEVEYLPLPSSTVATPVLDEFVSMLSGYLRDMEGCPEGRLLKMTFPHQQFGLSDDFTDQHSAVQYILLCKTFAQGPGKPPAW